MGRVKSRAKHVVTWTKSFRDKMISCIWNSEGNGKPNAQANNEGPVSTSSQGLINANMEASYIRLAEEFNMLKIEHERLQTEISTLPSDKPTVRPYRTNFTRSDAQRGFEEFVTGVINWVDKWTDDFIVEKDFLRRFLEFFNNGPEIATRFRQFIHSNQDLLSAVGYPDTDQDILSACIVRFVWQRVFGEVSCSISSGTAESLKKIEHTMSLCTAPKINVPAIHAWRAQAYHAIFSDSEYSNTRQAGIDALTAELAQILGFIPESPKMSEFVQSIASEIIEPSLRLDENFRRAHEWYFIEKSDWTKPGALMGEGLSNGELRELLKNLDCTNTAKNRDIFQEEKLNPRPTPEELQKQLYFICSINPALKVRGFRKGSDQESTTIVKESVLVAWDPDRLQGGDPRTLKSETWLAKVCTI
ncbi:hypothetical protein E0Z10_g5647 [Xylaria hypoxylon]|uniref:Uncharacterized protein n=1 Tax=Xylaria hypoxylon TaxID=37992 RepID=A0A4Z0Z3B3_9PEZI|nr:hypothetical protein E0Z10_g5647 [Xylaria hypoxylon]